MHRQQRLDRFRASRFGMFIHWGLYSVLGRGEWVMKRDGIPAAEYQALADHWNPRAFSPDSWCRAARDAGMKYAVFTTVHHDGFALFDTRTDDFNSVKSPARRDFVAEFVAACRNYDLGVGLYVSLVDWRFLENGRCDVAQGKRLMDLAHARIRELMTAYGPIDMLWYDGAACPTRENPTREDVAEFWDATALNAMVRTLQPGILINNRSGVDEDFGTIEGRNIIRPPANVEAWEACMTLGDDDFSYWGYCQNAIHRRTPTQALLLLLHTLEFGGNLLLNVGPDADGVIPAWQQEILWVVGAWVRENAEAVYAVQPTAVSRPTPKSHQGNSCGFFTANGDVLYFYLYEWPGNQTRIPLLNKAITLITVLKTGQPLPFHRDASGALVVTGLPSNPIDPLCTVLKMI